MDLEHFAKRYVKSKVNQNLSFEELGKLLIIDEYLNMELKQNILDKYEGVFPLLRPDPSIFPYMVRVKSLLRTRPSNPIFNSFAMMASAVSLSAVHSPQDELFFLGSMTAISVWMYFSESLRNPFEEVYLMDSFRINPDDLHILARYLLH